MHSDVSLVPLKELSLNDYATKELEKVATELGYIVSTNKSRLVSQIPTKLHASRFQSSKPDLFMFNPKLQECYMVNEDNATIFAGAGDELLVALVAIWTARKKDYLKNNYSWTYY